MAGGAISSSSCSAVADSWPSWYATNVTNPVESRAFLSQSLLDKLEAAAKEVCSELEDAAPEWEVLYEKANYVAKKKVGTQIMHVKVESVLPYSLLDVAAVLVDWKRQKELDGAITIHELTKAFSNHTNVQFSQYAAVRLLIID